MNSSYMSRSKSAKRQLSHQNIFMLLGSACIIDAHKMLMKLTPIVNLNKILQAAFPLIYYFAKILQSQTVST